MEIVEKFPAEFEIKLVAGSGNPLADVLRLKLQIFFVVKTDPVHTLRLPQ